MAHTPVVLNVYNMYWLNEYTSSVGIGVYHSGLEIYGREFAFGGHPFEFTGIFETEPKDIAELGEEFTYKETISLGFTDFSEGDMNSLIEMLGKGYTGSSYHLIERNCNHFTNELSKLLTGKTIPNWVNRLATICVRFPFIAACIPKEWLTPDGDALTNFIDLTEWEEIEYPPDNEKEKSGEFRKSLGSSNEFRSGYSGSNSSEFRKKCFQKEDEKDYGHEDSSETVSLTQMLDELNKPSPNRSPSSESLINRLNVFEHSESMDEKQPNQITESRDYDERGTCS